MPSTPFITPSPRRASRPLVLTCALLLAACGGSDTADLPGAALPEETRLQDSRSFTAVPASDLSAYPDYQAAIDGSASFQALPNSNTTTNRWTGVLDGAPYRIEVPQNWNGKLVMYAHGYEGASPELRVTTPTALRRYLIDNGYAWAASGYSKNQYDVRTGVEDTNALALAFTRIASSRGRTLTAPNKIYITGHSMGGHITAAAVEAETYATSRQKLKYDGAVPMCGVTGDTELFNYIARYRLVAAALAGYPNQPIDQWATIAEDVKDRLFVSFPAIPTSSGLKLRDAVRQLTGGERPVFDVGFAFAPVQNVVWNTAFPVDPTIDGIFNKSVIDTQNAVFQFDSNPALSAEETSLNNSISLRLSPAVDVNRLRRDGLRWVPQVQGDIQTPVVALYGLGDHYVPFSMAQIYRQRADALGKGDRLVQRSLRSPGHCDFTAAEQVRAFADMVDWAENGPTRKPEGDDVLSAATVAAPRYGCRFTNNATGIDDDPTVAVVRALVPACPP